MFHVSNPFRPSFHALILSCGLAAPALALDLPEPLSESDFIQFDQKQAELGQLLFYDKILSGNQNISCGTCHHHELGGTDGLALGVGEGGLGLGPERLTSTNGDNPIKSRIPRNAPALWNLAHKDVDSVFHDGRLEISDLYGNGFVTPAQERLPLGLNSILAAQALFPMTSDAEMAGHPGENEIAGAVHDRIDLAWPIIAKRVRSIPEYGELFVAAFDHIDRPEQVTIVEIANAIAAFEGTEWRNFDSPFDKYLAGDTTAMTDQQIRGMELFYDEVGCAGCHAGSMLSDQGFHALGLPQFGPGRTRPHDPMPRDVGRMGFTDALDDAYRFNTPFLRNIALTAPYGHNGAMPTLRDMVMHHLNPRESLQKWQPEMADLPDAVWLASTDFIIQQDKLEMKRQWSVLDIDLPPVTDAQVDDIVAFLHALTGETALTRPLGRPDRVPSGLPID